MENATIGRSGKPAGNLTEDVFGSHRSKDAAIGTFQRIVAFKGVLAICGYGGNTLDDAQFRTIGMLGNNKIAGPGRHVAICVGIN